MWYLAFLSTPFPESVLVMSLVFRYATGARVVISFIARIRKPRNGRNPILNLQRNFLACPITPFFHREIVYYTETFSAAAAGLNNLL